MIRSWLLFPAVSAVCAFLLAICNTRFTGVGLSPWVAVVSLAAGFLFSGFVSLRNLRRFAEFWRRLERWGQALFLLLIFGGSLNFISLFSEVNGFWGTASPNNLGDLPFHLHLINFFARGAAFPPMDPTFAGESLHYPFAIDLWDALWVTLGVSPSQCFLVTGLISLLIAMIALWRAGNFILVCAFFFSGGLSVALGWQDTFGPGSSMVWKNLFHTVFITQRGFLWALPAGLYVVEKWNLYLNDKSVRMPLAFFLIWAVMPFFHLHTFIVLSFWMGLTILMTRRFPTLLIFAALIALAFIFRSVTTSNVSSAVGWNWGWMFKSPTHLFVNLGPWCLLPFFVLWRWVQKRDWKNVFVAVTLTFFALNLRVAPWEWDQVKILIWVYLLWTIWGMQEYKWSKASAAVLSLFLFWPGLLQWLSGWPAFTGRFAMQDGADRASIEKLISGLSPDDTVAAQVDHRHPLLGLGQSLVLGYAGHTWSHGLAANHHMEGLTQIFSGLPGADKFAKELRVKWIVGNDKMGRGPVPPNAAWSAWGWKEEKRVGEWYLWKTKVGTGSL